MSAREKHLTLAGNFRRTAAKFAAAGNAEMAAYWEELAQGKEALANDKRLMVNENRRLRRDAIKSLGLSPVRGVVSGETYWE